MDGIKRTANKAYNSENVYNENIGIRRDSYKLRSNRQVLGATRTIKDGSKIPQLLAQPKEVKSLQPFNYKEAVAITEEKLNKLVAKSKSRKPLLITPEEFIDTFLYSKNLEERRALPINFMDGTVVNNKIRQILVDWMMSITTRFSMEHETCHLAIAIMDRSINRLRPLQRNQLQLLAATCVFLAGKNEEVAMNHGADFVYMADNSFSLKDLLKMEIKVFAAINFNANFPTAIGFLRRYRLFTESSSDNHLLAKLIVDLGYLDCKLCVKRPSIIALCAHYLANYLVDVDFDPILLKMNGITHHEFMGEVSDFLEPVISYITKNKECSVRRKYSITFTEAQKTKLISLKSKSH